MIEKVIIGMLMIATYNSECTDFCLRCVSNVCTICDLSNGYKLSNGTCVSASLENCYLFNDSGSCLICNSGYNLDSTTQKCFKISTENVLTNCASYGSSTSCSYCSAGYALTNGTCV